MTPDDTAPENAARRTGMIAALGAVPVLIVGTVFLMGLGGDPDTTSIDNQQTTATTSPAFIDATATNTPATSSTPTTVTPTTFMPTTTVAPASTALEAPLKQPIDPPLDPRGHEDHVELGGIAIPKLGIDTPLLEGIRLTTLDNSPGHWPGSAMPGEVGNVVVAGHRTATTPRSETSTNSSQVTSSSSPPRRAASTTRSRAHRSSIPTRSGLSIRPIPPLPRCSPATHLGPPDSASSSTLS